jgi:hypothetical protein
MTASRILVAKGASIAGAAAFLHLKKRRVLQLIDAGKLTSTGVGQCRRIPWASLYAEARRRNLATALPSGSLQSLQPESLQSLHAPCVEHIDFSLESGHSRTGLMNFQINQIGSLLGLLGAITHRLAITGAIRSREIGDRRRVEIEDLHAWARGEQKGASL